MKKKIRPTKCPFCFRPSYRYRTFGGLLRHVIFNHLRDENQNWTFMDEAKYLAVHTEDGVELVEITDRKEVEDFLEDYVENRFNPSKKSSRLWKYVQN